MKNRYSNNRSCKFILDAKKNESFFMFAKSKDQKWISWPIKPYLISFQNYFDFIKQLLPCNLNMNNAPKICEIWFLHLKYKFWCFKKKKII